MKDQIAFIIDTLETAIEWADYADDYFKKKHGLDQDKENVKKSIEILSSLEEQNQGLQSLLDLKQQEISVLESKVEELVIKNSEAYRQGADDVYLLLTGKKVNE